MLDQRRRRSADVVQMLYKCFVFAGEEYFTNILHTHVQIDELSGSSWTFAQHHFSSLQTYRSVLVQEHCPAGSNFQSVWTDGAGVQSARRFHGKRGRSSIIDNGS